MALKIYITKSYDRMSRTTSGLVEKDILEGLATEKKYVLGLPTGSSPAGLYRLLAHSFNSGRIDPGKITTFNLDEYVGLPGETPALRAGHSKSYSSFMKENFFSLLKKPFKNSYIPAGELIDQKLLLKALEENKDQYELSGDESGRAVSIKKSASGILAQIKKEILDSYEKSICSAGGIDLQIIGVGASGHIAFHESGIPFSAGCVMLVKLARDTIENAVLDGQFKSPGESPHFAVSMGARLVYSARKVVLLASGSRKTKPVTESLLGPVTCRVPLSYSRRYAESGGEMVYILDREAAGGIVKNSDEIKKRGCEIIEL